MAPTAPVCCLDSTPIFTFSNVVNALNIREVWKVLATPSRFTLYGLRPITLIACPFAGVKSIEPSCGVYTPVRQLNNEVLPAPFGPMIDRISPRRKLSDTSLRLVTPPNLRVTCWIENTRSSACSGATSGIRSVIASPGLCSRARQGTTFRKRTAVSLPLTCCVRGRPDFPHVLRPPR